MPIKLSWPMSAKSDIIKFSWPMSAKSDEKFFYSERKKKKLPWPISAKSDT